MISNRNGPSRRLRSKPLSNKSKSTVSASDSSIVQMSGVKRVVNDLQVMTKAKEAALKVRDEDIGRDGKKAFETAD